MLQAGVIATRPATAPDAAPIEVGLPSLNFSTASQPRMPAAGAASVLRNASAATPSAAASEPALKPNQPNHSSPAPSSVSGTLCGLPLPFANPSRLPSTSARASAAAPALICTAVPPAKSFTPRLLTIQPPSTIEPSSPSVKLKTQFATGKYTTVAQTPAKTIQAPNFARSAIAPEISATVMIANVAWNAAKASGGNPADSGTSISDARPSRSVSMPSTPSIPMKFPVPAFENDMA